MPRFYFDVFDGRSILDTDGIDVPDANDILEEALRIAGGMIECEASRIAAGRSWIMQVRNEIGQQFIRVELSIQTA